MRVVSLLPSATETLLTLTGWRGRLHGLGLSEDSGVQLVGRSHECDWPAMDALRRVPVLTGARTTFTTSAAVDAAVREQLATGESLYTLDTRLLEALRPDVILTQDLCAVCSIDLATVRAAAARMTARDGGPTRIVSLNPRTFEDVLEDVSRIGEAVGLAARAMEVTVGLRERAYRAEEYVNPYADGPSVAVLEWTEPLFAGGHWTPQMVERAGGRHPLNPTMAVGDTGAAAGPIGQTMRRAGKSVVVSVEALAESRPEYVVIAPCGLTLEQAWQETEMLARRGWWGALPAVRAGRVAVVDGNQMFNRPGPRVVDALEFLVGFVNERPEVIPAGFPWRRFPRP